MKESLYDKSYIIYEHDHKYLKNRNPSIFPDFKAPPHMIINERFYRCAKAIFCQSEIMPRSLGKISQSEMLSILAVAYGAPSN